MSEHPYFGPAPIKNWIVTIPGFLQTRGSAKQGVPLIYHRLYDRFAGPVNLQLETWNSDFTGLAEQIFRLAENGGTQPKIMVVAYSWGGGYGCMALAKELYARGLTIDVAVLSDAVFHFGTRVWHNLGVAQAVAYWPWLDSWSRFKRPAITVSPAIREVHWWLQKNSRLRGHELVRKIGKEVIPAENRHEITLGTTHTNMDDNPEFRACCMMQAEKLFGNPLEKSL